jgi:uncharacterized membrane protein YoaK (UPF0700 family)
MLNIQVAHLRAKSAVALLMTFAAGCVDIVGYIELFQTFVAHMTGNTVHVAHDLIERHWWAAGKSACVIAAFLIGSVIGRGLIEMGARKRMRNIASVTILVEMVVIFVVAQFGPRVLPVNPGSATLFTILSLLAGAMGLQTATLTRIGPLTVHTTFVTGMLNKLAQLISKTLYLTFDIIRSGVATDIASTKQQRSHTLWQTGFFFSIWLCYLAGAIAGTGLHPRWGLRALYLAVVLMMAGIGVDQFIPLSIEEESE